MKKSTIITVVVIGVFLALLPIFLIIKNRMSEFNEEEDGYYFVFYYENTYENGTLSADSNNSIWISENSCWRIKIRGSKEGNEFVKFFAEPNEGYQVKAWLCNGEVVEGIKTNTYSVWLYEPGEVYVTVEFEPIICEDGEE